MPSDLSLRLSESNSNKRKIKNKMPKRLRRKNKPNDVHTDSNPSREHASPIKQPFIQESAPFSLNTFPSSETNKNLIVESIYDTSTQYWRSCTKKAIDILEKQSISRRKYFIERHQERINSIQCLLFQREQIEKLTKENQSISDSFDFLRNELRTKDERIKHLEDKLDDRDDLIRDNDFLRVQLKLNEQKFERYTIEYNKKLDDYREHDHEYHEQIQSLMDEIERIKRDLILEEYRKQEGERKARYFEEKYKLEQNQMRKIHSEIVQLKQDLKSIQFKYDTLQIEMLEMHKANQTDMSLIPTKDTNDESLSIKKRSMNDDSDEYVEMKRSKRKTRDRTESSASSQSDTKKKIIAKSSTTQDEDDDDDDNQTHSSLPTRRKTINSNKSPINHRPIVMITRASPSVDQTSLAEKDTEQLLLPPSVSATSDGSSAATDSCETSSESQPVKPRTKKASRYPCRRAQRPPKQIDTSDQIKQS